MKAIPNSSPCDWKAAAKHLATVDRKLAPLIEAHGLPTWHPTTKPVESLARNIVYQQLTGAAAGTIHKRFLALFSNRFPSTAVLAAADVKRLRSAGLSQGKALALIDLATKVQAKAFSPRALLTMSNEEVSAALLPVRGIGPWSVDMFLMFALSRPDVLPVGDLGVRKGMQKLYRMRELPLPAAMEKRAAPWRPYRTLGSWLMWRVLENG